MEKITTNCLSKSLSYEKIYFSLWETAQRYGNFARFRVIGKSHDDRLIPMLEIGEGTVCIFCLAGVMGTDFFMPSCLVQIAQEYCQSYECGWTLDEDYQVDMLLDQVRICFIPVLNPDGYEICQNGYSSIRNTVFRQMLRMQGCPPKQFALNARGINLRKNFPTSYYTRTHIHQEPASENETKALLHIFQEYDSIGLLSFRQAEKKIVYYGQNRDFFHNQKGLRMARQLQKHCDCSLKKYSVSKKERRAYSADAIGSPEQFYAEMIKQPSLTIETPILSENQKERTYQDYKKRQEITLLPLEYIYSFGKNRKIC